MLYRAFLSFLQKLLGYYMPNKRRIINVSTKSMNYLANHNNALFLIVS